jgi:hypothetical protein
MRVIIAFVCILFSLSALHAEEDLKTYADFQALHINTTIDSIDLALLEASDFLERNPDKDELFLHDTLAKYVAHTPSLRAIISTNAVGLLIIDSFTYPRKHVDLHDREYIKQALNTPDRTLYIGSPVLGRTSGLSFIPFTHSLLNSDKNIIGTVTGIMHPGFLIKQHQLCAQCFMGVFNKIGQQLVAYPSQMTYPNSFIKQLNERSDYTIEHTLNERAVTSWVVFIKKYGLHLVLSNFVANN